MTQIMISLSTIRDNSPCSDGWLKVLASKGKTKADNELFPLSDILTSNGFDDLLWSLRCLPEYDNLWRKFAWWCAIQVVDNTTDKRVSDCLDVTWKFSEGKVTKEELSAARSAARSAVGSAVGSAVESAVESAQQDKLLRLLELGEWEDCDWED